MTPLKCETNRLDMWRSDSAGDRDGHVTHNVDTITRLEGEIAAFVPDSIDIDAIESWTESSDRSAESPPLFAGAPVAIKEIIAVEGFARRAGSLLPPEAFSPDEASIVGKLRSIGCIPFAHSVSTEFAYFQPGPTRNPRNPQYSPGGSSSGSAAAVAAGMCPLAVGTQTIGSVIRPASYCGIVGYKPTYGELARDGVHPVSRTVDHLGFFTQDIDGMEWLANGLGLLGEARGVEEQIEYRLCAGPYTKQASEQMLGEVYALSEAMKSRGRLVTTEELFPNIEGLNEHHRRIMARDFFHAHVALYGAYGDRYRAKSRELFEEGSSVTVADYEVSLDAREQEIAAFDVLSRNGIRSIVWLSPAATGPAPLGLESTGSPLLNLPWTHVGAPAITVPMAIDEPTGLPLGVQICAPRGRDDLLFRAARDVIDARAGSGMW